MNRDLITQIESDCCLLIRIAVCRQAVMAAGLIVATTQSICAQDC